MMGYNSKSIKCVTDDVFQPLCRCCPTDGAGCSVCDRRVPWAVTDIGLELRRRPSTVSPDPGSTCWRVAGGLTARRVARRSSSPAQVRSTRPPTSSSMHLTHALACSLSEQVQSREEGRRSATGMGPCNRQSGSGGAHSASRQIEQSTSWPVLLAYT
ncbi:hypothetical protein OH77DRAFT_1023302 [Trametes cingulata]|nr:hypothetical protein OH77DRAFT_1023302 [Trametes cingulata]